VLVATLVPGTESWARIQITFRGFLTGCESAKPFGFKSIQNGPLLFLLDGIRAGLRKRPSLFEQLDKGQADEF